MEGGSAKVVRLTPEQREQALQKKERILEERRQRIARQDAEKKRILESKFSLVTEVVAKAVEPPVNALYRFCAKLKRLLTPSAWRYKMRTSGWAASLIFAGTFSAMCIGADGVEKWRTGCEFNQITTVGLNKILDVMFHNDTQISTWYIGLVVATPSYSAADTMASHAGWTESTAYSETLRQTWTEDAAAAGAITNSTSVDFSMNATATIAGMFLTSDSAKSGTAGTLWSALNFSGGNQAVSNGDTLKVTYTLTASA